MKGAQEKNNARRQNTRRTAAMFFGHQPMSNLYKPVADEILEYSRAVNCDCQCSRTITLAAVIRVNTGLAIHDSYITHERLTERVITCRYKIRKERKNVTNCPSWGLNLGICINPSSTNKYSFTAKIILSIKMQLLQLYG